MKLELLLVEHVPGLRDAFLAFRARGMEKGLNPA